MQNPIGLRMSQGGQLSGPGAASLKYDILTALLVVAAQGDPTDARLCMRLSLIITARFNWRHGSFSVGLKEIARMWGVTERTAKRDMAEMRGRGWLRIKTPAARGRVAEHAIEFEEILRASMPHWAAIGPDYVARMTATPEPAEPSKSNVIPLHRAMTDQLSGIQDIWTDAAARIQAEDPALFGAWLASLELLEHENGILTLSAPSRFVADYVQTHFRMRILAAVLANDRTVRMVQIVPRG